MDDLDRFFFCSWSLYGIYCDIYMDGTSCNANFHMANMEMKAGCLCGMVFVSSNLFAYSVNVSRPAIVFNHGGIMFQVYQSPLFCGYFL